MIENNKVVSLDYTVRDDSGQVIDTSEGNDPLVYLHGAQNIIPGLESALVGKESGEHFDISVQPADGYGEYKEELVQVVPRSAFEGVDKIEPGMVFTAQTEGGPVQLMVTGIEEDDITVDPNHPLAGKVLHFSGTVLGIREATQEELDHGHVHGAGGRTH